MSESESESGPERTQRQVDKAGQVVTHRCYRSFHLSTVSTASERYISQELLERLGSKKAKPGHEC